MTVREAIKYEVSIPGIPEGTLDKKALDLSLNPTEEYNATTHKVLVDSASLAVLYSLRGVNSISEGGFSISIDQDSVEARISFLVNGADSKPTVRAVKVW